MGDNRSVCSGGGQVHYFWRFCSTSKHIEETAKFATEKLIKSGYRVAGILQADLEGQIEELLECAERGELEPLKHIKRIHRAKPLDIYEIRWTDIKVLTEEKASGLYSQANVHLRLYTVEEGGSWVVGLYLHEKKIVNVDEAETNMLQNIEIDAAIELCEKCSEDNWKVSELDSLRKRNRNPPAV